MCATKCKCKATAAARRVRGCSAHNAGSPLAFASVPGGTRQVYFNADDLSAFVRAPAQTLCGALPRTCESVGLATYNKRRRGGLWS